MTGRRKWPSPPRVGIAMLASAAALVGVWRADHVAVEARRAEQATLGLPLLPEIAAAFGIDTAGEAAGGIPASERSSSEQLQESAITANAIWARAVEIEARAPDRAATLVGLASRMTRRHFPSQAWLLEQAVERGSIRDVLAQYDVLMTIWPNVAPKLVERLVLVARDEPKIVQALLTFSQRPWFGTFLVEAARQDGRLFIPHLQRHVSQLPADARIPAYAAYLSALVSTGQIKTSVALVLADRAIPDELVASFPPSARTVDTRWGELAWRLAATPDATAVLTGDGQRVELDMAADVTTTLLERTTVLPPGAYRLSMAFELEPMTAAPLLSLSMTCSGETPVTFRGTINPERRASADSRVVLPAGCLSQRWAIRGIAGTSPQSSVTVYRIALTPD